MALSTWLTRRRIEIGSAVLMSAAALGTSWSGYQSTVWNGEQAILATRVIDLRTCATRALNRAGRERVIDIMIFLSWAAARSERREESRLFHEQRFRDEFKPAFDAWLKTNPETDPDAPPTPFVMQEYRVAADSEAVRCERRGVSAEAQSQQANALGDAYVLNSVIFAVVLFFAGAAQNVDVPKARSLMLAFALLVFAAGLVYLARLPVH